MYRSFGKWYAALLKAALARHGALDLQARRDPADARRHEGAPRDASRGGARAPARRIASAASASARATSRRSRARIMWPSNALSSYTRWRDDRTAAYLGFGPSMPDLGFAEGMRDDELREHPSHRHRTATFWSCRCATMSRSRRGPYPDTRVVRGHPRSRGRRRDSGSGWSRRSSVDDERSRRLARTSTPSCSSGPSLGDHGRPGGAAARASTGAPRVAASDRLHVIIAAFTEGAAPVGLQLDDSDKVSRHFATIGIDDVAINTTGTDGRSSSRERSCEIAGRRDRAICSAASLARASWLRVRKPSFHELIAGGTGTAPRAGCGRREPRPRVSRRPRRRHPRRHDPGHQRLPVVAVRERVGVEVHRVAGRPGRPRRRPHAASSRALRKVRAIARRGERAVIVVHLSERGSFVREGMDRALRGAASACRSIAHLHGSEFAAVRAATTRTSVGECSRRAPRSSALATRRATISARHVRRGPNVELVPNAIPAGTSRDEEKLVVFGGVVSHRKGIDVLQDAWRDVLRPVPRVATRRRGPDPRRAPRRPLAARAPSSLGSVGHDALMELLERRRGRRAAVAGRGDADVHPRGDGTTRLRHLDDGRRHPAASRTTAAARSSARRRDAARRGARPGARRRRAGARVSRLAGTPGSWTSYSAEAVFPRVERIWLDALNDPAAMSGQRFALRSA